MIARSAHFIFDKKVKYKHLAKAFPDIFNTFLEESGQMPEEEEFARMLIKANLKDLELDRKPEGYNRQSRFRMIFPLTDDNRVSFYVYCSQKTEEVGKMAEKISSILKKKRLKHKLEWDQMYLYYLKEEKEKEK